MVVYINFVDENQRNQYNENDNNKHVFVNLPHLVLNRITKYLNSNLESISFSLVCKKWFEEREKYLDLIVTDKFTDHRFYLKDYQQLLVNQWNKYHRTLYVGEEEVQEDYCEYFLNYNEIDFENYKIPKNINKIILSKNFNIDLKLFHKLLAESNVETITMEFGCKYNHPIDGDTFPGNIKNIYLGTNWNQPLNRPGCFANGLKHLHLGFKFDEPLGKDCFPSTLKDLELSFSFKKLLKPGDLPEGLVNLKLGQSYNSPIEKNVIPTSLESLDFVGFSFNQSIDAGVLLPAAANLKHIRAGRRFDIKDIGLLYNLKELDLTNISDMNFNLSVLPGNLKSIVFGSNVSMLYGTFPARLEQLVLKSYNDVALEKGTYLPNSLKSIVGMPEFWFQFIGGLPALESVTCQSNDFQYVPKPGDIPSSLTYLDFNHNPTVLNPNTIPPTIKHLFLRKCIYDLEVPGTLPMNAQFETLYLANYGDKPIRPGVIPPSVKHLIVELQNAIDLKPGSIPLGVQSLEINFQVLLDYNSFLPESVTDLTLSSPPTGFNINNNHDSYYMFWEEKCILTPSITSLSLRNSTAHLPLLTKSLGNIINLKLGNDSMFKRIDEKYFVVFNQNSSVKGFVHQSQLTKVHLPK